MDLDHSLCDHIRQLEQQLLQPEVRRSRHDLDGLLADEFTEFASDGVAYSKEEVVEALEPEVVYRRSLTDFPVAGLAENVVLATYRVTRQNDTLKESIVSLRSSIWTRREGRWQLLFHQGTTCATP
jgi:hypothetical protein